MPFNTSVLNSVHGRIHRGEFFSSCDTSTLGSNETIYYLITTGSHPAHFSYNISSDSGILITLRKQVTATDRGTALARLNVNDISTISPIIEIHVGATLSNTGIKWEELLVGGAGVFSQGDSMGSRIEEHVLALNDFYAIELTNPNIASVNAAVNMGWYEPK